ncbi:hypothetical protein PQ459_15020 [Chryseobacterium sp. KACC 21268]|nr:hypothetical protein PQ459_15020 [Chryseobacterium sp. KACC 21268]
MINFENLLSALIGSVIGIFISGSFGRLNNAIKINSYRKLILVYSKFIVIRKAEKYISNFEESKSYILDFVEMHNYGKKAEIKFDAMPMFNSDIYKSIPTEFLYKIFLNKELYTDFLDTIYSIDFLKSNMPSNKISEFNQNIKNHITYQNIPLKEVNNHLEDCSTVKNLIERFQKDSDFKIKRAKGIIYEVTNIDEKLKGNNIIWIIRYFFSQ